MFTGLIEEVGAVQSISRSSQGAKLQIKAATMLEGLKVGDSIAVNGVCLTAVSFDRSGFVADAMGETLRRSNLGGLGPGDKVNLERALRLGDRLGGHLVSGHIDGTGEVSSLQQEDNAVWITITAEPALLRYIVEKGSIAIDGVSLTVAGVDSSSFSVSIIPHTGGVTTLLEKKPGAKVNLECDVIGKYVEKLMGIQAPAPQEPNSGLNLETLEKYGFV